MNCASDILRKLTWQSISETEMITSAPFRLQTECLKWLDMAVFVFENVNVADGGLFFTPQNVPLTGLTLPFNDQSLKHHNGWCSVFSNLQTWYLNLVAKFCSLCVDYHKGVISDLQNIFKFMKTYCHALSPFCDENYKPCALVWSSLWVSGRRYGHRRAWQLTVQYILSSNYRNRSI